jgi:hypothetical protein
LELLAGNHVAGVFELSHLSPEVAISLVEQCLQPTERQPFVPSQQDGGPESCAMLQQIVQLAERELGRGLLTSSLHADALP